MQDKIDKIQREINEIKVLTQLKKDALDDIVLKKSSLSSPVFAVAPGYEALSSVLERALKQAQAGKGKDRHASGEAFDKQPIIVIGQLVGEGFQLGQELKIAHESRRLKPQAAVKELLGAINYLAARIIAIEQEQEDAKY
jgi:hypothetical protein